MFYNTYLCHKADGTTIEKNEFQKLKYHFVGTIQNEDILCAEFNNEPNWMGHVTVSECGNFLLMNISKSCDPKNQLWLYDLKRNNHEITTNMNFTKLINHFDAKYNVNLFVF